MLDSSGQSLENFTFASDTRNYARGKQRHFVDAFRTVCWFHHLRLAVGATATYQMDLLLEPPPAQGLKRLDDRKNKWRGYRLGRHTPSSALVSEIEARHPGGQQLLNLPLWQIMRLDVPIESSVELLGKMAPEVYASVFHSASVLGGRGIRTPERGDIQCRHLERLASMDSLAGLILLMRLAGKAENSFLAYRFGRTATRVLSILGSWLWDHGIAQPMADYFGNHLLTSVNTGIYSLTFDPTRFLRHVVFLEKEAARIAADENGKLTHQQRITAFRKLM
ncbi:MAG: hypothetical protein HHJ17_11560 [Rhodoferax sp.]|uniref:hypothetical protein n=1 Tax=Rhodoferax sp. TaxID=50421 RepID=UPI00184D0A10|nr:hypothetical protein [Rhodoferax sp.]NMM14159.1 hypothetical protein [Rhodoferax sp.]